MKGKGILTKLATGLRAYESAIGDAEQKLANDISFDFSVVYQPSDGFCVVHANSARLAPLETVISVIDQRGHISETDFFDHCI